VIVLTLVTAHIGRAVAGETLNRIIVLQPSLRKPARCPPASSLSEHALSGWFEQQTNWETQVDVLSGICFIVQLLTRILSDEVIAAC
jgi:hypothetical protein